MTDVAAIARRLTDAQRCYILAVGESEGPYQMRHGTTANWALRHGYVDTIILLRDGREGFFEYEECVNVGITKLLGQRLTPLGLAVRAHLQENTNEPR